MAEEELGAVPRRSTCEVASLKTGLSECSVRVGEGTDSLDTEKGQTGDSSEERRPVCLGTMTWCWKLGR